MTFPYCVVATHVDNQNNAAACTGKVAGVLLLVCGNMIPTSVGLENNTI